ncbi:MULTISPECIES: glutamate--tRNA ligase [Bacillaceae]|uniref:Glutamate--tRNA ligase n=2 Tax=Bacillaceae TaxID=186817 RepID=A0A9D5HXL2_9BACI|nr:MULTISPECIES: glutamate--tRNA ligase [Bacillaceae]KQL56842.1 glutamyl-tRNA synthetase [Alkalicoccobacillus plakortidis]MBG9782491.1 glutamyl-tRNA synthetase [Shouchella lehensis]RQW23568.1 glutamate--tRNA ligase [Bacillus sp. C1-1]TES49062.1 glutamate--tRNA ligase [Shouchella lehensis]
MAKEVRVRFAPSPTGHLHIGGARSALFNYLMAKHTNGTFVLRIEDTDQARNVETATEKLMDSLKWLGIQWDESVDTEHGEYGPYRSMERVHLYKDYIQQLVDEGKAYYCYMTEDELEAEREAQKARGEMPKYSGRDRDLTAEQRQAYEAKGIKPVVRFKVPQDQMITFHDSVREEVSFDSNGIGDFVIARKDGVPMYNFAVVVDDHLMKISHVIRGEEHLSNTPRQILLFEAFGWEVPTFAHASLILNPNRQKMSKRDESIIQFVEQYKELGYMPEAIVNFLALLGWSPVGEEEIFTLKQLEEQFTLDRVSKAPAVFDTDKLAWMNNQYIKEADLDEVIDLALPHLISSGRVSENMGEERLEWAKRLIGLYQEQMQYGAEIVTLTEQFFKKDVDYTEDAKAVLAEEQVPEVLEQFAKELDQLEEFTVPEIKKAIKATQKATGQKGKKLFMPIRAAVSGQTHGPELGDTIELLGKAVVTSRLQEAVQQ